MFLPHCIPHASGPPYQFLLGVNMNVSSACACLLKNIAKNLPQIVEWAFGKRMTPAERLRKHQRALDRTQRELDRERTKLENQEKKLIQDIKKSAKNGQIGACKIQAKDLVRTRRYLTRTSCS
jgi:GTP cyclohydrolase III